MSYAPNPEGLRSAFAAERFSFEETSVQFALVEAGRLTVANGRIAAGDTQADPAPEPFTQCVPNGEFPVTLALARFENGEERIAYARVLLDGAAPAHWYPALTADQDARTLNDGEMFGYAVASGSACFASGDSSVEFSVGAGLYPSYFAYDGAGRVTALVTDFAVVPGIRDLPGPRRSWWNRVLFFWK
ncbi:DUF4241 domain-containing protein [Pseudoduganella eburnea]|uniref:DUF4241 domain-containing protein n=1 Tax=Massilia eburnea TaxID=1776165 RepID=A0A6L6QEB4_9BURK|nr:DUF4241 domain-containing protein [Massilia eburnea]MTW10197.1 DUF4241 domain-containing protein [Massilia eburnea]